jgi:hypothetical protein
MTKLDRINNSIDDVKEDLRAIKAKGLYNKPRNRAIYNALQDDLAELYRQWDEEYKAFPELYKR